MNRVCKKCQLELPLSKFSFAFSRGVKTKYRIHTCNKCRKEKEYDKHPEKRTSVENIRRLKLWRSKNRGTIDGFIYSNLHRWRKRSPVPCNLTFKYLKELWNTQQGKCFYTGVELSNFSAGRSRNTLTRAGRGIGSPSLDRLTPHLGYTENNVVWASAAVNSMKGDLTKEQFLELCTLIINTAKS